MGSHMRTFVCALGLFASGTVYPLEWSANQIEYLYGNQFHEPFNAVPVEKNTVTFQHASGYSLGENFAFLDLLQSGASDRNAFEYYGEGYTSFSLGKQGWVQPKGLVKDVSLTAGVNFGEKSYPTYTVSPRVLLAGPTIDLAVPGFNFVNVNVLAYVNRGLFAGGDNGCHATTWQITPAWNADFSLSGEKFAFEGFLDLIGAHGTCAQRLIAQPRIRWNIGDRFGQPDRWFLGIEYLYWKNKFGIKGEMERSPQLFLMLKL